MLLRLSTPPLPAGAVVRLRAWHAAPGARLLSGDALLDLTVDLSAGIVQDCPPVSVCRIVLREEARLVRQLADLDGDAPADAVLALLATGPADPADGAPVREARVTVAAVLDHADWWGG